MRAATPVEVIDFIDDEDKGCNHLGHKIKLESHV